MIKFNKNLITTALAVTFVLGLTGLIMAATTVNLGTADNFAILAGSTITNTGATVINGDLGLSPGDSVTGFPPGTLHGTQQVANATAVQAKTDLITAYNNAAGQVPIATVSPVLGGTTKTAGVYSSTDGTFGITGTLTLDAQNDPSAVFIFKTTETLITASLSNISLINGAQACNVFWQVGSSATLGTDSTLRGNILALTSVTLNTGASVEGRVLARNGAVTLDTNTVTKATCAAVSSPAARNNTLTVVTQVINDNGGKALYSDFPLFINGQPATSGQSVGRVAGVYTITETSPSGYTTTFAGDCNAQGQVTMEGIGSYNKLCLVINNDKKAVAVAFTPVSVPPLISIEKIPTPLVLPAGAGSITYDYTVLNVGTVPMSNVTVIDDKCATINFVSGDTNNDAKLDTNEIWKYRCTTTLSQTTTSSVSATGSANGLTAVDVANATVVVGQPIEPPLIHVIEIPQPLILPTGAGVVTYTKKVTNPGTVALSNVKVTNDKCSPMTYVSGDTDNDSKLDHTETWVYTCQTGLDKTTTNTAIAIADANGLKAIDVAHATVVVVAPKLPNTGVAPDEKNTPWNIIALAGIFVLISTSLVVILKKHAI